METDSEATRCAPKRVDQAGQGVRSPDAEPPHQPAAEDLRPDSGQPTGQAGTGQTDDDRSDHGGEPAAKGSAR